MLYMHTVSEKRQDYCKPGSRRQVKTAPGQGESDRDQAYAGAFLVREHFP